MGERSKSGALVLAVGAVKMPDGQILQYVGPSVVTFNLIEARRHQLKAEGTRAQILERLQQPNGGSDPAAMTAVFDFLSAASSSVLMAFAAVEGFANALIDNLPDGTQLPFERDEATVMYEKEMMVRRLSIAEKLDIVAPIATKGASQKGTAAWARFVDLRRLRDELVHIKRFGYAGEPENPAAYGRLIRGDGSKAVQDAAGIIVAISPDWVPKPARDEIGI